MFEILAMVFWFYIYAVIFFVVFSFLLYLIFAPLFFIFEFTCIQIHLKRQKRTERF